MEDVWKQFEENSITHSAAHHLLAVMQLRRERGYARVTDVAKFLNITTGSASTNLKSLRAKGLIEEDDNKFLVLSDRGALLAKAVIARKEIFKKFLTDVLNVEGEQAEIDACKTEHLLSHETSEKLMNFMQAMSRKRGKDGTGLQRFLSCEIDCTQCPATKDGSGNISECSVCDDHCLLADC